MTTKWISLLDLSEQSSQHSRFERWFQDTEVILKSYFAEIHNAETSGEIGIIELGDVVFPYFEMGNVNSSALFGLDELLLFSFYLKNRGRYKRTLDLGANIGLHTLVMKKLGFDVVSYEPDQVHLAQIDKVMKLNGFDSSGVRARAISDKSGTMEYIRILGNTTGSHLAGSKEVVYGPTEIVQVPVDDILQILTNENFDFVKMDVEGHEVVLLNRITPESIAKTDIVLEIGSEKNANEIFEILTSKNIPAYAQKINWNRVEKLEDLPSHHTHGSLFLSMQGAPNWN